MQVPESYSQIESVFILRINCMDGEFISSLELQPEDSQNNKNKLFLPGADPPPLSRNKI